MPPHSTATAAPPTSIIDQFGSRICCTAICRVVVSAWAIPAATSMWTSGGLLGLWSVGTGSLVRTVELGQAVAVALVPITVIVGAIWAVRTWTESSDEGQLMIEPGPPLRSHAAALVAAIVLAIAAEVSTIASAMLITGLWWSAALLAIIAVMAVPRWLSRVRDVPTRPMAWFVLVMSAQMTVGWVPLVGGPDGFSALDTGIILVTGLAMAVSAALAVRIVPDVLVSDAVVGAVSLDVRTGSSDDEAVGIATGGPGQPSLPEPAVGH